MFAGICTLFSKWFTTSSTPSPSYPTPTTASPSPVEDIESQIIVGRHETTVVPALTYATPPSLSRPAPSRTLPANDPLDAFFGRAANPPHDATPPESFAIDDIPPPPYTEATNPPSYTAVAEPPTLAMYLFRYGFLFPFFWVAGAFILVNPLPPPTADEDWEPGKTEEEKAALLALLRKTELKWARRCLTAAALLVVAICVGVLVGVVVVRSS